MREVTRELIHAWEETSGTPRRRWRAVRIKSPDIIHCQYVLESAEQDALGGDRWVQVHAISEKENEPTVALFEGLMSLHMQPTGRIPPTTNDLKTKLGIR